MPRPTKKIIDFTPDALKSVLQSIYAEAEESGLKATQQYLKQNRDVKDNLDIAQVSKINAEYLKLRNEATEKKLSVARIVKDIIYKDTASAKDKDKEGQTDNSVISEDDKKAIFKLIKGGNDVKNNAANS